MAQQQPHHLELAARCRAHKGRISVIVAPIDLGPVGEEKLGEREMAVRSGDHERRFAVAASRIRIGTRIEEVGNRLRVAGRRRLEER